METIKERIERVKREYELIENGFDPINGWNIVEIKRRKGDYRKWN